MLVNDCKNILKCVLQREFLRVSYFYPVLIWSRGVRVCVWFRDGLGLLPGNIDLFISSSFVLCANHTFIILDYDFNTTACVDILLLIACCAYRCTVSANSLPRILVYVARNHQRIVCVLEQRNLVLNRSGGVILQLLFIPFRVLWESPSVVSRFLFYYVRHCRER